MDCCFNKKFNRFQLKSLKNDIIIKVMWYGRNYKRFYKEILIRENNREIRKWKSKIINSKWRIKKW